MDRQAVYGILFSQDKKQVLLVERRDLPVWVLPGGGLELGESPVQGVLREFEEETGFQVAVKRQTAEYLPVNRLTQKTHVFECTVMGGEARANAEARRVSFFPINQLPKRLAPPFKGWILDAQQEHSVPLRKEIEGVSYFILIKLLLLHPILVVRYFLSKIGIRFNKTG